MIVIKETTVEDVKRFQKKIRKFKANMLYATYFNPVMFDIETFPPLVTKEEALEKFMKTPPKPKPISREEGQCDFCSFRVTDVCSIGHNCKDHCGGMGHRMLECPDYLWYGTPSPDVELFLKKQEIELVHGNYKWCKCREMTRYARLYMKIFRWFKDWQFDRVMKEAEIRSQEKIKELDLVDIDLGILVEPDSKTPNVGKKPVFLIFDEEEK